MTNLWLPAAIDDIQRLFDYLVPLDAGAAQRAVQVILEGADQLFEAPEPGRPMSDDTRRRELSLPFAGGAYVLRYRIHAATVVIIRVWHSREQR